MVQCVGRRRARNFVVVTEHGLLSKESVGKEKERDSSAKWSIHEPVMTMSNDSLQVLEHSAQSLFSLPCTVHFPLHSNNCVESLNRYLLQSVDDIQHSVQTLSDRTSRRLGVSNRGGPRENLSTLFARCL
jgi:hypothetical protein